ncbi:hypothetical protein Droror1_Dr00014892 [Drosera rotundifolia]
MVEKEKKRRRKKEPAVDRLSVLPDEVLIRILSFLPTGAAVQTSVLSKRWAGLFSKATGLQFDDEINMTGFTNLVDRVLKLHKVSIERFKLWFKGMKERDVSRVEAWIASALSLGARELDLLLKYQLDDMTQHNLLRSSTLTVLKLKYHETLANLNVPTSVCLSSLNILKFTGIIFPDVSSTRRFFLGCPSLKDLTLCECQWMDGKVYNISSAKLRNLTISLWKCHQYKKTPTIVLDLPDMVYFEYCGVPWELYRIKNPIALATAELNLGGMENKAHHGVVRLMKELSNVKVLRLFNDSLRSIEQSEVPTFENLLRLEVGISSDEEQKGWRLLPKLLARSPMLGTLVFKEGLDCCYDVIGTLAEEQRDPFSPNPLDIQVDDYTGAKKERRMVKLFLRSRAFNVKQIIVNTVKDYFEICSRRIIGSRY